MEPSQILTCEYCKTTRRPCPLVSLFASGLRNWPQQFHRCDPGSGNLLHFQAYFHLGSPNFHSVFVLQIFYQVLRYQVQTEKDIDLLCPRSLWKTSVWVDTPGCFAIRASLFTWNGCLRLWFPIVSVLRIKGISERLRIFSWVFTSTRNPKKEPSVCISYRKETGQTLALSWNGRGNVVCPMRECPG